MTIFLYQINYQTYPTNETNKIDSYILQLIVSLYHHDLNTQLLNEFVFKRLYGLEVNGQIKSIQDDLFKSFKDLCLLRIRTQNTRGILTHRNKWLIYLNYNFEIKDLENQYDFAENHDNYSY